MTDSKLLVVLNVQRIGALWPEQGGRFGGITGGKEGIPFGAIIVPEDKRAHFENVALGTYDKNVTGARSRTDGRANTIALAEAGSDLCRQILQLEIEGHRDLILPAANDQLVLAANVPELFSFDDYYWSSTQYSSITAFVQGFESGDHNLGLKSRERRACAVRVIQLSDLSI